MIIIGTVVATVLSAILYRFGGWGNEGRARFPKLPEWFFNTKARDMGCAAVCLGWMLLYYTAVPWWIHFIAFGALFGFLTTYWDFLFGYDNHWFHGFACGMAYMPYAIITGDWIGFGARVLAVTVLMGGISALSGNDFVEEFGRGGALAVTLPLFLI